jgi:two-component system, NtrC family, nitrogen regulation response regulator NtrX
VAQKAHLLIVDDEANTLASLSRAFRLEGHEAAVCDNANKALELARSQSFDLILSDVVMPGKDGLALLEELKAQGIATPIVMMSGQAHIEMAVRATRLGALDFLEKPISTEKLLLTVENALKLGRLERDNRDLERRLGKHEIIWQGDTMRRVMAQVERVAASETRVCILGETGTGKELVARTLHERSPRAGGPFVTLNCAAVPAELIETELFGHEKGSFTGAAGRHLGKFEQAQYGTIFLDEIGDMPLAMQAKLLRVLEEGEVERIGGERRHLRGCASYRRHTPRPRSAGARRQVPAGFISPRVRFPLAPASAARAPRRHSRVDRALCCSGDRHQRLEAHALYRRRHGALQEHSWPGNVRELRNAVERLMLLATSDEVTSEIVGLALPVSVAAPDSASGAGPLADRVRAFEKQTILAELKRNHHQISNTARALGLERSHLYKKAEQVGIDLKATRNEGER